jgi:hypothetical protein
MIKRFKNFSDFTSEMHLEFSRTQNERLKAYINLATTLNQGCGCTRRARSEAALREYLAIGEYLSEDNINLMRNKWPGHTLEFAQDDAVFFMIEP